MQAQRRLKGPAVGILHPIKIIREETIGHNRRLEAKCHWTGRTPCANRKNKKQADTARKRKQEEDRRRRQLNREIKAIVSKHRMNDAAAEIPRNFMYRGRIRKINLTPVQLKALNAGGVGVVYLSGGYHLLAPEHVEAVRKLSGDHVPDLAAGASEDEKGFPVPDDLIW